MMCSTDVLVQSVEPHSVSSAKRTRSGLWGSSRANSGSSSPHVNGSPGSNRGQSPVKQRPRRSPGTAASADSAGSPAAKPAQAHLVVQPVECGSLGCTDYRLVYQDSQGCGISPLDLPLFSSAGNLCTTPQGRSDQFADNESWVPLRLKRVPDSAADRVYSVLPYASPACWNVG